MQHSKLQQYVSQTLLYVAWLPYCHTRCKHTLAHLTLKKACGEGLHEGEEGETGRGSGRRTNERYGLTVNAISSEGSFLHGDAILEVNGERTKYAPMWKVV